LNAEYGERKPNTVDRLQLEIAELRRSRKRMAEAADADRRAMERALHDGVQQHLVALVVDLQRMAGLVEADPAAKALVDEMATNVRQALDEATDLARTIYPPLAEGRGLASAVRSAAERAGVAVSVDVPARAGYPPEITAAVYWSLFDALSAASPGSQASISVRNADGTLTFEVAIPEHLARERLDHLRDRIEALDGGLSVEDRQNGGSRVHGWLPLP
jgi:signal transduction histidine kinase